MKRRFAGLTAMTAALALTLGACGGGGGRGGDDAEANIGGDDAAVTIEDGATIGVSLPWLGTQNWKEADNIFKTDLKDAGYKPIVQAADNKVPNQQAQLESMIEQGAKVLVVGPIDGTQLSSVLEKAKDDGIVILGYDRMIENTEAVDGVIQFGSFTTGEFQAEALLQGLEEEKGEAPYNVELFAGGPADPNAQLFFDGAMSKLQPKIDDGTLEIVSGQTDFTQAATQDWDNGKAQSRMDSILSGNYSDKEIDGVLSPNDGIARAIITSSEQAGQEIPVVSGLDAEDESIAWIASGKQYSTVAKPTQELVDQTMDIIESLSNGDGMPEANETLDNGAKDVDVYALEPTIITGDNLEEFFADNDDIMKIINDNK